MKIDLLKRLRCCPTCGVLIRNPEFLCSLCQGLFFKRVRLNKIFINSLNVEVYSLLIWQKEDPFVSRFIYSLKKGQNKKGFHFLTQVIFEWGVDFLGKSFVPIPPSKSKRKDHALEFSHQLSTKFKGEVLNQILRSDDGGQKEKSKKERAKVSLSLTGSMKKKKKIVLVDDVVTTGSSLRAACNLYEKTTQIQAITIAYRPYFGLN